MYINELALNPNSKSKRVWSQS